MDYWQGCMNWPLAKDWVCPVCGENAGLEWGVRHAQCRCNACHARFTMVEWDKPGKPVVDRPIPTIKPEYAQAEQWLWERNHRPLDEYEDADWDASFAALGLPNPTEVTAAAP